MDTLLQDLRYGVRLLLKSPGFTIAAVVALALGIGANTAIFSVVNAVLLRPLPYAEADRVMMVWESNPKRGWDQFAVSPANYLDWAGQSRAFAAMAAMRTGPLTLTGRSEPERLSGLFATSQLLDLVGARPALGRSFLDEEYTPGKDRVVLLGDALWKTRFGGRAEILGSPIVLNAESYTVVGILPEGFRLPTGADALAPLAFSAEDAQRRGGHYLVVMARLKRGTDEAAAAAEMRDLALRLEKDHPDTNTGWTVKVVPLYEEVVGGIRPALLALFGAVGFVLLIACANVANLMLVRSTARRGEIAVRTALGAGSVRLLRQLLTESLLLAFLGGGLGLLLGLWSVDLLKTLQPGNIPRLEALAIDPAVLAFTLGLSLLTGIVFGIVPALLLARAPILANLQESGRALRGRFSGRFRGALVVTQVALSLVLLIGAGLQIRSFERLLSVSPGFDPQGVLTLKVSLPEKKYPGDADQSAFYARVTAALAVMPGVRSAAAVTTVPLSDNDLIFSVEVEGRPPTLPTERISANWYGVGPEYFAALRIPLRKGRLFNEHDVAGAARVMLINETMARRVFPGEDPIGHRIKNGLDESVAREIVGVVGDVRHYGLDQDVTMQMYEPVAQQPWSSMAFVLRADSDPAGLAAAARRAVMAVDPDQPVFQVRTLAEIVAETTAQRRFSLLLLCLFAGVALLLAAVGIYGVVAYSVAQRTHEIGVRMALGAPRREILGLVLRQGMGLALGGVATGLVGAFALTRLVRSLLFGVSPTDPVTFAATALVLSTVTLIATYIPARRATRVEPTVALRYE